jgi:uncharacterized protein YciI
VDRALAAGNAVHGLTAQVGYGKHTPAGTGSLGLAEACLMYGGIMYDLLLYDVVDQFADRRTPYRDAHLKLARAAAANGELLPGGAFADPVDGAALVFKAADQPVAKRFAANDPYVTAGLVTKWTVRKWTVVVEAVAQPYFKRSATHAPRLGCSACPLRGYLSRGQQSLFGRRDVQDGRGDLA